jgi:hypothetical protein
MSEIISAKCFGCGHEVKVPSALGGKKARCPKCTNTIVIPTPSDTGEILVSDADLPEVARDDEILTGEEVVEGEGEPAEGDAGDEGPVPGTRSRRRAAREGKSGARMQPARYGAAPKKKGSPVGLIVGIGVAVVAVIVIAVAASGSKKDGGKKAAGTGQDKPIQDSPDELGGAEIATRTEEYARAVKRRDISKVMEFYAFDRSNPGEEREVRRGVTSILEKNPDYGDLQFKSSRASGETGSVTFDCAAEKGKTLNWKKVDGVWLIADKP